MNRCVRLVIWMLLIMLLIWVIWRVYKQSVTEGYDDVELGGTKLYGRHGFRGKVRELGVGSYVQKSPLGLSVRKSPGIELTFDIYADQHMDRRYREGKVISHRTYKFNPDLQGQYIKNPQGMHRDEQGNKYLKVGGEYDEQRESMERPLRFEGIQRFSRGDLVSMGEYEWIKDPMGEWIPTQISEGKIIQTENVGPVPVPSKRVILPEQLEVSDLWELAGGYGVLRVIVVSDSAVSPSIELFSGRDFQGESQVFPLSSGRKIELVPDLSFKSIEVGSGHIVEIGCNGNIMTLTGPIRMSSLESSRHRINVKKVSGKEIAVPSGETLAGAVEAESEGQFELTPELWSAIKGAVVKAVSKAMVRLSGGMSIGEVDVELDPGLQVPERVRVAITNAVKRAVPKLVQNMA